MAGGERGGTPGSPDRLPPDFGNYSILEHLATGGMAEVYLARKSGLQGFEKFVVIKRIRPEIAHETRTMTLLLDEARLVATLEHPNIAQVYEIERASDSYFIVMEYVQGADLRQIIDAAAATRHAISLADALYIISHVCAALHYAHEKCDQDDRPLDIIHRDISPSNVLVSHDGAIKVCDFGIAKGRKRTTETVDGVVKGKLSYMSPEQCRSDHLDRRSDVFAIGILLYELTTRVKLFNAKSEFEVLRMIIEDPIPHPSRRVPGYPDGLARIVMRALAKRSEDRYPTAQALQAELESFAREHRLAMSSIAIARLMGKLFERPSGRYPRHASEGFRDGDADTDVDTQRHVPILHAEGTGTTPVMRIEPAVRSSQPIPRVAGEPRYVEQSELTPAEPAPPPPAARAPSQRGVAIRAPAPRPSIAWLVAALLAGGAAGATFLVVPAAPSSAEVEAALHADIARLATTIDAVARSSQQEVNRIAEWPMLRMAIATDAATIHDLVTNEQVLKAAPNEVLEIFQVQNNTMIPLARVPPTAAALPPPKPVADIVLTSDGKDLRLLASTPIIGKGATGVIESAVPVDLTQVIADLEHSTRSARIVGITPEVPLVQRGDATGLTIRVTAPSTTMPGGALAVLATIEPPSATTPSWLPLLRIGAAGVALVALAGYIVLLATRRHQPE